MNITAVQSMTTEFHAQITDATGTYWAKINTGDLSITKEGQASVVLTGAGAHNGKIYGTDSDYASDKGHLYAIDPNDGYSVVTGALVDAENAPWT
ncbi:MAG: hypothetical protein IJ357_04395 [Oscillospiraceae bacterium]|nr:hypothetical protein [Oscillospiraceae bacterium]